MSVDEWICSCGQKNNSKFCVHCGKSKSEGSVKSPKNKSQKTSSAMSNKQLYIIAGVVFVLALAIGGFIGWKLVVSQNENVTEIKKETISETPPKSEKNSNEVDRKKQNESTSKPEENKEKQNLSDLDFHWIKDKNNVWLWNPEPTEGESISWSGSFVQENGYKFANGSGILTWYQNGKIIQVDEGTFEKGRHHGHFYHKFPSGRIDESDWNHGVEIFKNSFSGTHYVGTYRSGLKAFMLLDTLKISNDGKSFDVKIKATGYETVYLDYHIWTEGRNVKFANSQGFSGTVKQSSTPIEYAMWKFVQENM